MRIIVEPQNDKFIDQLWSAITKFLQISKEKHPELPKMEIIMEATPTPNHCAHVFKIVDVMPGLAMIRCQRCQVVYHAEMEGSKVPG